MPQMALTGTILKEAFSQNCHTLLHATANPKSVCASVVAAGRLNAWPES
jgi:hypothetical protein